MIRGTTPTLQFTLPVEHSELSCMYVTLSQCGIVVVEKCITDCDCNGADVSCCLTQKDTLALTDRRPVDIQVRAKTSDGTAMASQVYTIPALRNLKDGEI